MISKGILKLDKHRVKDVILSLRNQNRELARQSVGRDQESDHLDDFIYL
jgi:hypothetical protein